MHRQKADTIRMAAKLYGRGVFPGLGDAARFFGLHRDTVSRACVAAGIPIRPYKPGRPTKDRYRVWDA